MGKLKDLPLFKQDRWFENDNTIWMLTTFELHRNLKTHFFPHKLEKEFLEKLTEMLSNVLVSSPEIKKGAFFEAANLLPLEKQLIYEHFFPKADYAQYRNGEGFVIGQSGRFYTTLNIEDHIKFHLIDPDENLEESWTKLLKIESHLAKSLEFAYSQKFGFCTSDHKKCGTGLILQTYLHLPALIHLGELEKAVNKVHRSFFKVEGFGGSFEKGLGDLVLISNRHTLGISEETLLKNIRRVTLELILAEKNKRESLSADEEAQLKDKVGKAFGALKHSSRLTIHEALEELSLCKMGLEMGWLTGLSQKEINTLFFSARRGYLSLLNPGQEDHEVIRSNYLKTKINALSQKS